MNPGKGQLVNTLVQCDKRDDQGGGRVAKSKRSHLRSACHRADRERFSEAITVEKGREADGEGVGSRAPALTQWRRPHACSLLPSPT